MLHPAACMLLYHAGCTAVKDIDLNRCHEGHDLGKGFYLSASLRQAAEAVPQAVKRAVRLNRIDAGFHTEDGMVSVYRFHYDPSLLHRCFQEADREWLHFAAANRDHSLFPKLLHKYQAIDIVSGKTAGDKAAKTLMLYLEKTYGMPGTAKADSAALSELQPESLQEQFCFRTEDAVSCLEFVRSERCADAVQSLGSQPSDLPDQQKNVCAVITMRNAVL